MNTGIKSAQEILRSEDANGLLKYQPEQNKEYKIVFLQQTVIAAMKEYGSQFTPEIVEERLKKLKEDNATLLNVLRLAQRKIQWAILNTPTGEEREDLTATNIQIVAAIQKATN